MSIVVKASTLMSFPPRSSMTHGPIQSIATVCQGVKGAVRGARLLYWRELHLRR